MNQVKANSKLKGKLNFIVSEMVWKAVCWQHGLHQIPTWKQKGKVSSKTKNPWTTFTVKLELKPLWQTPNYKWVKRWQTFEQENLQRAPGVHWIACWNSQRGADETRWGPSSLTVGESKRSIVSSVMNDQTVQPEPPLDTELHMREKLCRQNRLGHGQQRQGVRTSRWE